MCVYPATGGPLKPGFGLSGYLQISAILSSRPEQIAAKAVICGVEGPGVASSTGAEEHVEIASNGRHENANKPRPHLEVVTVRVRNPRVIASVSFAPPPQSVIVLFPLISPSLGRTTH